MNPKKILSEWFIITFGTVVAASAVFFFLIPSHLAVGSISGLAIILANFIPLKISAITMGLNVALLVVGLLFIGRDFGIKTIYTSVLMPVVLAVLEILFPDMQSIMGDGFLDMLLYIFTVSIGLAILFNRNASSGGLDIIAKLLNKYLRMDLGKAMSLAGICTALTAAPGVRCINRAVKHPGNVSERDCAGSFHFRIQYQEAGLHLVEQGSRH